MLRYVPASHSNGTLAPLVQKDPASHSSQLDLPIVGEYVPAAQSEHALAPPSEYVPGRHGCSVEEPRTQYVPAVQALQEPLPCAPSTAEDEPAGHSSGVIVPPLQKLPAAQTVMGQDRRGERRRCVCEVRVRSACSFNRGGACPCAGARRTLRAAWMDTADELNGWHLAVGVASRAP